MADIAMRSGLEVEVILFVIEVMEKAPQHHLIFYFYLSNLTVRPHIDDEHAWIDSSR
jgi:hypothetical protein